MSKNPKLIIALLLLFNFNALKASNINKTKTESAGDDIQYAILAAGLGTSIFYEKGNEGTIQFFKAVIATQIFVHEAKNSIKKNRPNGNCCNSFPSGHAAASFTGATFIYERYGWEYGLPAYIASSWVSYSRVYADKHYVEDVVAGALIGLASGFYFTDQYEDLKVIPVVTKEQVGLYFSMSFD